MSDHEDPSIRVNPGYILDQLRRAAGQAGAAAAERVEAWKQVLAGLADGALAIGSRTPVAGLPPWVTLRVLHGGFASGEALAGGPLLAHEQARLAGVDVPAGMSERAALNLDSLAGDGAEELDSRLSDGRYRIDLPEEAALLVVAWLRARGEDDAALELTEELLPFSDQLRFYPVPLEAAPPEGEALWVRTAGEVREALRRRPENARVEAQREALAIWTPWADAAADLFLETCDGEWPLQVFHEGWSHRALAHAMDFDRLAEEHLRCGKPRRPRETLAVLREFLERASKDPTTLDGYQVGRLRQALRGYLAKHGEPGSPRRLELRAAQARVAAMPAHQELAQALATRLAEAPSDQGLADPDDYLAPFDPEEAGAPTPVPAALRTRVEAARAGSLEELLEAGILGSSEEVARQLAALTATAVAAGYPDPALGRLVGRTYRAFRDRRSLLLLDLQSQVGFGELPWVRAVTGHGAPATEAARGVLGRAIDATLGTFPHTPTPNKLVKELRTLGRAAGLDLVLTEELAADIFMGTFSGVFLRSAQGAAELLDGSLYARVYGLPFERVRGMTASEAGPSGKRTCPAFDALCRELAGTAPAGTTGRWSPAANGVVIEQAQLLTTHNLAALHRLAGEDLVASYPELARRCFTWVCARLQLSIEPWVPRLRNIKNAAYGWRQMIFFLALAGDDAAGDFLKWARTHLHQQPRDFVRRFEPALRGLEVAHRGEVLTDTEEARRFLGWSRGRPWVMGPAAG